MTGKRHFDRGGRGHRASLPGGRHVRGPSSSARRAPAPRRPPRSRASGARGHPRKSPSAPPGRRPRFPSDSACSGALRRRSGQGRAGPLRPPAAVPRVADRPEAEETATRRTSTVASSCASGRSSSRSSSRTPRSTPRSSGWRKTTTSAPSCCRFSTRPASTRGAASTTSGISNCPAPSATRSSTS
jgi:hypothetical protein